MPRAKTASPPIDRAEPALIDEAERAVRAAKAVPLSRLVRSKWTPEARAELERLLEERGLERGPKAMRVPIDTQVTDLVRGGTRVPLRDVSKRIKGASKKEIDTALDRLLAAGTVKVVVRTQTEVLTGGDEHALDRGQLPALKKLSEQLGKTLRKVLAKGRPRSILLDDLNTLLAPLRAAAAGPRDRAQASETVQAGQGVGETESVGAGETAARLVGDALERLEDPKLKLIRIADLVRALDAVVPVAQVHQVLQQAAESGTLELVPEAGSEFLKPEDARLCPPGPRGTVFSYARRLC